MKKIITLILSMFIIVFSINIVNSVGEKENSGNINNGLLNINSEKEWNISEEDRKKLYIKIDKIIKEKLENKYSKEKRIKIYKLVKQRIKKIDSKNLKKKESLEFIDMMMSYYILRDGGLETKLGIPLAISPNELNEVEECIGLGGSLLDKNNIGKKCCSNLRPVNPVSAFKFSGNTLLVSGKICANISDGICDIKYENKFNSPKDCKELKPEFIRLKKEWSIRRPGDDAKYNICGELKNYAITVYSPYGFYFNQYSSYEEANAVKFVVIGGKTIKRGDWHGNTYVCGELPRDSWKIEYGGGNYRPEPPKPEPPKPPRPEPPLPPHPIPPEPGICNSFNTCRIQPYSQNNWFWQYKGKPVMLLGGSSNDNLFQNSNVKEELNLIQSVGGNYIRNTMSARDDGDIQAFAKNSRGKYDLNRFNSSYWDKFEYLLKKAEDRDIIVQIEVWDRFDFYDDMWSRNPFNPKINDTYTTQNTYLRNNHTQDEAKRERGKKHPFFNTIYNKNDKKRNVLKYQKKYIDKMLSYTSKHPNVLFTISNETGEPIEWSNYWASYIKSYYNKKGKKVEITEMKDIQNLKSNRHKEVWNNSLYTFGDISQNNSSKHNGFEGHWNNTNYVRNYLKSKPRPLNNTKIYGGSYYREGYGYKYGTTEDGIGFFWLNILGGTASARFHRDTVGLGINSIAQRQIKIARKIEEKLSFFELKPNNNLLSSRSDKEAFLTYKRGYGYIVFFPKSGRVKLDLRSDNSDYNIEWVDLKTGRWSSRRTIRGGRKIELNTPYSKGSIAILSNKVLSCSMEYKPVCVEETFHKTKRTYSNICLAGIKNILYQGKCEDKVFDNDIYETLK